jgi:tight adherence protein B
MNLVDNLSIAVLRWGALGLVSAGAAVAATSTATNRESLPYRIWSRYCASIERRLYKMFIWMPGRRIAIAQVVAILLVVAAELLFKLKPIMFLALLFFCIALPELWLGRMMAKRVAAIEMQVDGFLIALANALKSRPSIADAFISIQAVIPNPLRQEVELAVKQMRVGSTLEQAVLHMTGRVGSRQLDTALSAILIGRQVGGNLPSILETTAAAMREMARLEGVVRTKTAEGKAQIWVLAAFPFVLLVAFNLVSPGYFDPLTSCWAGYICTALGFFFWGASIVTARKILTVDI